MSLRMLAAVAAAGVIFGIISRLHGVQLRFLTWSILAAGIALSFVANVQVDRNAWKLNPVNRAVYGWFEHVPRVSDAALNQNAVAAFLVLAIPFGVALALDGQIAAGAITALLAEELWLTESRAAILSVGLAVGVFAFYHRSPWRWLAAAGPLGAIGLLRSGWLGLAFNLTGLPTGDSSAERLAIWQSALAMIADLPLTGIGPGMFQRTYALYILPAFHTIHPHAHNLLLQTYLDLGPLGLVGLILLAASAGIAAVRLYKHPPEDAACRVLGGGAAASSLAVLMHAQVDSYFAGDPRTYFVMFVPLAILAASAGHGWRIDGRWIAAGVVVPMGLLPRLLWTNVGAIDRLRGDAAGARTAYERAPGSWIAQRGLGLLDLADGEYSAAAAELSAALDHGAPGQLPHFELGQALYALGDEQAAIAQWKTSDAASYLVRLAEQPKDHGDQEALLRVALRVDPQQPEGKTELARLYVADARWNEARPLLLTEPSPDSTLLLGLMDYWQEGNLDLAASELQLAARNGSPASARALADILADAGQPAVVDSVAIQASPGAAVTARSEPPDMLGQAYEALGLYSLAEAEYRRLAAGNGPDPIGDYDLGRLQAQESHPEVAAAELGRAVQAIPNQEQFRLALAHAYLDAGKPRDALQQYRVVLELDPGSAEARAALHA